MNARTLSRLACLALGLVFGLSAALPALADSLASSASSAGSASSNSVSASLNGSSNSSNGRERRADVHYRITEIAQVAAVEGRAGMVRLTLQADAPQPGLVLDLPQTVFSAQGLGTGDRVLARHRAYGLAFAREDNREEAFYLVLADDWYGELAPQQVRL